MNFSNKLIGWYQDNKRDLPWRNTVNPYHIWLSEIILQQTRVLQGTPCYLAFLKAFPTIEDLANAPEFKVLKMWQGLGYYSRARNLHFTAKDIVNNFGGEFPKDYRKMLQFKGIGVYTAAAITSFAFDMPYAVVDGNVIRVLSRVFGVSIPSDTSVGKKQFQQLAQELLIEKESAIYNQAIMEFGAMKCKPKSPDCSNCPMQDFCVAYATNSVAELPVKSMKIKVKDRFLHYFLIEQEDNVFLGKRKSGIWIGLYEFPFLEFPIKMNQKQVMQSDEWSQRFLNSTCDVKSVSSEFIHILSHQKIYAQFWQINATGVKLEEYELIPRNSLLEFPVSRLTEKYFETIELG
ncbi:MAG: A/G-specific adenine glycosylase [Flavobacteriales bacterium]|jgi:A/G-specific adenine glycosylase|nr:A/G-specific adenine glycosylase [Flavobacteriales bacterium]MBT5749620.1 A/G-specific adenine glycosylase [Flavobacteriales bacterium]